MHSSLQSPKGLDIMDGNILYHGADQEWFSTAWRRQAGCGPTTAANLLRYAGSRAGLPYPSRTKTEMQALMEWIWGYVTPGVFGLNSTEQFQQGMERLLRDIGSPLRCHALAVLADKGDRPGTDAVAEFLRQAFEADSPVAFLNLDRGALLNLESWHWVSLIGMEAEPGSLRAEACDNGARLTLDLGLWLETTKRRGGFVYLA